MSLIFTLRKPQIELKQNIIKRVQLVEKLKHIQTNTQYSTDDTEVKSSLHICMKQNTTFLTIGIVKGRIHSAHTIQPGFGKGRKAV